MAHLERKNREITLSEYVKKLRLEFPCSRYHMDINEPRGEIQIKSLSSTGLDNKYVFLRCQIDKIDDLISHLEIARDTIKKGVIKAIDKKKKDENDD